MSHNLTFIFFFLNDPATTEISPLPLHDALPISRDWVEEVERRVAAGREFQDAVREVLAANAQLLVLARQQRKKKRKRSEEHTSELQSQSNLVCRLLLEKKKNIYCTRSYSITINS